LAEEEYVSYDKYRADLADFRADMARFREEVRGELGSLRLDMTRGMSSLREEMYKLHAHTIIWLASIVATGVALTVTLIKVIP
jgi:hypothetical protein